jgi:hypothetical protein
MRLEKIAEGVAEFDLTVDRSGKLLKPEQLGFDMDVSVSALRRFVAFGTDDLKAQEVAEGMNIETSEGRKLSIEQLKVFGQALVKYADGTGRDVRRIADSGKDCIEWKEPHERRKTGIAAKRLHEDVKTFQAENPEFAP